MKEQCPYMFVLYLILLLNISHLNVLQSSFTAREKRKQKLHDMFLKVTNIVKSQRDL